MASAQKHFTAFSDQEISEKQHKLENKNTLKNEEKATRAFRHYLSEIGQDNTDSFNYTKDELDYHLSKFWFSARTQQKGDYYSASSLETIQYGLNRALKRFGHQYDITKCECTSFTRSIEAFEDARKELKQLGKGRVKNHKEIQPQCKFCLKL